MPSPYSPFIRVEFDDHAEGHATVVSLEHLAYGYPETAEEHYVRTCTGDAGNTNL